MPRTIFCELEIGQRFTMCGSFDEYVKDSPITALRYCEDDEPVTMKTVVVMHEMTTVITHRLDHPWKFNEPWPGAGEFKYESPHGIKEKNT